MGSGEEISMRTALAIQTFLTVEPNCSLSVNCNQKANTTLATNYLGQSWDCFGLHWHPVACLGPAWSRLGPVLGCLGKACLGPCGACFKPILVCLGYVLDLSWVCLEGVLGLSWSALGHLGLP